MALFPGLMIGRPRQPISFSACLRVFLRSSTIIPRTFSSCATTRSAATGTTSSRSTRTSWSAMPPTCAGAGTAGRRSRTCSPARARPVGGFHLRRRPTLGVGTGAAHPEYRGISGHGVRAHPVSGYRRPGAVGRPGRDRRFAPRGRAAADDLGAVARRGRRRVGARLAHAHASAPPGARRSRPARRARRSREVLEDQLDRPCYSVAYPYGDVDYRVTEAARDAGYVVGAAMRQPERPLPLRWPRTPVFRGDSDLIFRLRTSPALRRGMGTSSGRMVINAARRLGGRM